MKNSEETLLGTCTYKKSMRLGDEVSGGLSETGSG